MPNFSGVWNLKDQVQAIAAGRWTGIPLYELYAWGRGANGRLGDNSAVNRSSPVQIGALTDWSYLTAGNDHSGAIKNDGTLWMWGLNTNGRLGDSSTQSRSSPVQIGLLTTWYEVSGGASHTAAVKTDGTLWSWGRNNQGQLGQNNITDLNSPVQVGALTTWAQVSSGGYQTGAVKTDGTLWMWGQNIDGRLGDGTTYGKSSPIQVGALTNWALVSTNNSTVAVKTDGTLWSWGGNFAGLIGDGQGFAAIAGRSSPVQIGALTNWSFAAAGGLHILATQTDGTLWTWGYNPDGRLGQNNTISRSSPVQIGALTTWSLLPQGNFYNTSFAIKTDGTLWSWGNNGNGQLADGTAANKSSPIQIGSETNWSQVASGNGHALAILQGTTN